MLIFNDGPPRAGKSYDVVLNHVVPALQKGRQVYARLDGFDDDACFAKIAAFASVPEAKVRECLHHVPTEDVVKLFQCRYQNPTGEEGAGRYVLADERLKNALVIIDEVHEFYPAAMRALPAEQEKFFARHGQFGMDVIVASQDFGAMHDDIRCRVERKVLFRKLSHFAALAWLGIGGKGRYSKRYYVTSGAGKFKEIKSEQHSYDARVFPLYRSFQPGVENLEVYEGGKVEAAGYGLKFYLPLAAVLGIVGLWFAFRIFDKDESPLLAQAKAAKQTPTLAQSAPGGTARADVKPPLPKLAPEKPKHSPGIAYVLGLVEQQNRPRAAGYWETPDGRRGGWVEFRSSQAHAMERLTLDDLMALGFSVEPMSYGFVLRAEGEEIIATFWPLNDDWGRVSERDTDRVRGPGRSAGTRASAATTAGPVPPTPTGNLADTEAQQAPYGAFRG